MRQVVAILLLGLLTGCAAHRGEPRTVSGNWSTVQALAPGSEVAIYLGEQYRRNGRLESVTDDNLSLRTRHGIDALQRKSIERVAIRTSTGRSRRGPIAKTALIAATIVGGLALLGTLWAENPPHNEFKWGLFVAGTAGGAAVGAMRAPEETFRERLVYIRP